MRIRGLVPLPPYHRFGNDAKVNFEPDTPFMLNDQRIGKLLSAIPTIDRRHLELEVELDEGLDLLEGWTII